MSAEVSCLVQKQDMGGVFGTWLICPVTATLLEYYMSGGESGWPPTIAALLVGLVASAITLLIWHSIYPNEREFSPRKPWELVSEVKNQTTLAAQATVARHAGKWLSVSGEIDDIVDVGPSSVLVFVGIHYENDPGYWLKFDSKTWRDKLKSYNVGDRIQAEGKIRTFDWAGVRLVDCELKPPASDK